MNGSNEIREKREDKKSNGFLTLLKKSLAVRIASAVVILAAVAAAAVLGTVSYFTHSGKTTKIGFEDIGELATQEARCTEIENIKDAREFFGLFEIPFTQSHYIYSYDVEIKAGIDFGEIEWKAADGKINVKLPEVKVLSNEIDLDSFEVYLEDESIFQQITLEENNEAMTELKDRAEENAVANGLLEKARENAETILTSFFAQVYDLDEYEIVFE